MVELIGADIARLRELGSAFGDQGEAVRSAARRIDAALAATTWAGADAELFTTDWQSRLRAALLAAALALEEQARVVGANADQQEAASAPDAGAPAGAFPLVAPAAWTPGAVGAGRPGAEVPPDAQGFLDGLAGMTPAQVAAAWAALPQSTRDWLLTHRPWRMGNLDGIPYADRDAANRAELNRYWDKLETAWALAHEQLPDEPDATLQRYVWSLAGLTEEQARTVENLHAQLGTGKPGDYGDLGSDGHLIGFDMKHEGATRGAVAVGDLDTASYVGVYVPGIGTRFGKGEELGTSLTNMGALRDETGWILHGYGADKSDVAQVFWLGYSAPAGLDDGLSAITALGPNRAEDGGTSLAGFGDGLDAVNPDARKTVQGHSYGSVTSAYGLARTEAFDAFVAFGSPGLPDDVAPDWHTWDNGSLDINVPDGERYFGYAFKDAVALSRAHGPTPGDWGFERLPTRRVDGYDNSTGHSEYLTPGTSFQHSLGAITAGHPEEVPGR